MQPTKVPFTKDQLDEEVWLNKVGTFGVGSAGYWWGRGGASLVRLSHYLTPRRLALWVLLYADDGNATASGPFFEMALLYHLLLLCVLGTPLKWPKVRGGIQYEWVGYWLDISRFTLGVSAARASWAATWLEDKVRERRVALGELR